jgi:hypothetical protein
MESAFGVEHGEFSKAGNPLATIGEGVGAKLRAVSTSRRVTGKGGAEFLQTASRLARDNPTAAGAVTVGVPTYAGYRALKRKK